MPRIEVGVGLAIIMVATSLCAIGLAQTGVTEQVSVTASDLTIQLESSRKESAAGSGLAVTATLLNTSKHLIFLAERRVSLTFPPELEPKGDVRGYWALFPSNFNPTAPTYDLLGSVVRLSPGDSYVIVWGKNPASGSAPVDSLPPTLWGALKNVYHQVSTDLQYVFFSPGDYKVIVDAQYWTDPQSADSDYRTATASLALHVVAPQFVILVGAAIGGLIAYFMLPETRETLLGVAKGGSGSIWIFGSRVVLKTGIGALGSALLSAIVTILLARISETQFLVKVTVSDLWGAIAVGFVASYAGSRVLDKILPPPRNPAAPDSNSPMVESANVSVVQAGSTATSTATDATDTQ